MRENVNTDKINPLPMGRSQKLALKFLDIDNKGKTSLKLKLQYFGYLMQTDDSLEKTVMLGKIEGRRRRGQQRMRSAVHGVTKCQTQLSD